MIRVGKALKFVLERWIQRGILHQLLFMAGLIVFVAVAGGLLAWIFSDGFDSAFDAIWWSFLRLSDPGYLGDDEGTALRTISTVVTILGYVLFMGSMVAIMTQWLARTIHRLESGLTPISMRGHVVVLGWTNRTPEIVAKLMGARGRLKRFLAQADIRRLRVVVQSVEVDAQRRLSLREHLGELWDEGAILLRSGDALQPEQLEWLDLARASVVIVPGSDYELGGAEMTDARAVKTLLSLRQILGSMPREDQPVVVAEIFDPARVAIAEQALRGRLEVVASDAVVGRLISQNVRHWLSTEVFFQLLSHRRGSSLYVRGHPDLAGEHPTALNPRFPQAVVIGAVRPGPDGPEAHLNPPSDFRLEPEDLLVLVAEEYADCVPSAAPPAAGSGPEPPGPTALSGDPAGEQGGTRRILVFGWSLKVPAILKEHSSSTEPRFEVVLASRHEPAAREQALERSASDPERVRVSHVRADYTALKDLTDLRPQEFDHVVYVASSQMESSEEADARTILGYVLLQSLLPASGPRPRVLVELLDPANARLFPETRDAVLVSPRLLSHLLAHVALRPELNAVFGALFATGGAEITIRPAAAYGLSDRTVGFDAIERAALARGEVALGVVMAANAPGGRLLLNPGAGWSGPFGPGDEVVVLAS